MVAGHEHNPAPRMLPHTKQPRSARRECKPGSNIGTRRHVAREGKSDGDVRPLPTGRRAGHHQIPGSAAIRSASSSDAAAPAMRR